jgi:hypothetical protein
MKLNMEGISRRSTYNMNGHMLIIWLNFEYAPQVAIHVRLMDASCVLIGVPISSL